MRLKAQLVPVTGLIVATVTVTYGWSDASGAGKEKTGAHASIARGHAMLDDSSYPRLRLAFITNNPADFWTIARKGTEKAKAELKNVDVDFRIPANGTAAEQKQIVEDLVARGNDGLAISPKDPTNQVQMLNDAARKTLVFTQDSDAPTSRRTCYIGTDNHAAGLQAGQEVKQALPHGGKIMLFVGSLDARNARDRRQGIVDALTGSRVRLVDTYTDEADKAKAKSNVTEALRKYRDLACLVGLWSYNGPAILSAVRDAHKIGKVKIIAFDEEDETLAGVRSGAIISTIVQNPFEFGHMSIVTMAKYLWGDKSVVPASHVIIVPTRVVDRGNVEPYWTQLKRLRGR